MKKITVAALVIAFLLGACLPTPAPNIPAPTDDLAATVIAIARTAVAQTLTAQPTPTEIPPSPTLAPTDTPVVTDATATETPTTDSTTTATSAPGETIVPTSTSLPSSGVTSTPTNGILLYGTQPPRVPYTDVTLHNVSKREAYISLQTRVEPWGQTVLEYPVPKWPKTIKAPIGDYAYVVWVGGKQIVGYFRLGKTPLSITIYKDKVEITIVASYP